MIYLPIVIFKLQGRQNYGMRGTNFPNQVSQLENIEKMPFDFGRFDPKSGEKTHFAC